MLLEKKISLVDQETGEPKYDQQIAKAIGQQQSPREDSKLEEDPPQEESKDIEASPQRSGHKRNRSEDDDCSPERKTKTKLKIGNKEI